MIQLSLPLQGEAEVVVKHGDAGLEANGLAKFGRRRTKILLEVAKNVTKGVVGIGKVGLKADGEPVFGMASSSFPCWPRASHKLSWKVASAGWRRMAVWYSAIACVRLPLDKQGEAEAVMSIGIVGPLADGLTVGRRGRLEDHSGFLRAALVLQCPAQTAKVATAGRP